MDLPVGLEREAHVERARHSPWPRRVVIVIALAGIVLALLNTFGQEPVYTSASSSAVSLTVEAPERLRGGLVFTTDFLITAKSDIHDLLVQMSPGWWEGMTLNAVAPQPGNESSSSQGITYEYGELKPGETMHVWISWQTNPTTVGTRDQDVTLLDGSQPLLAMQRAFTIFF